MNLSDHFLTIWRNRYRILGITVLVSVAVYLWSSSRPDVYQARASLTVNSGGGDSGDAPSEESTLFLTRTYAELATTRPVLQDAIRRAGLDISVETAERKVSAQAASDIGFITVTANASSAGDATKLARGLSEALPARVAAQQADDLRDALAPLRAEIDRIEDTLSNRPPGATENVVLQTRYDALVRSVTERELRPVDRIGVVAGARAGEQPVSPRPKRDALLALLASFVLTAELAVALEALSDRFPSEDETEEILRVTGLPVLARIPRGEGPDAAEAFHGLRTSLVFMEEARATRTLAIVSVDPGTGKSYTAINLARSLAALDLSVLLVDGDVRRPVIHERLGVRRAPGLTEVLRGHDLREAVVPAPGESGVLVLPAGSPVADPAGLLASDFARRIAPATAMSAMTIVDTPAELLFADATAIASQCDATLLVIDAQSSKRRAVRRMVERLRQINATPIGVVVNRTSAPNRASYYSRGETDPKPAWRR